jgi:hypothetical protein
MVTHCRLSFEDTTRITSDLEDGGRDSAIVATFPARSLAGRWQEDEL